MTIQEAKKIAVQKIRGASKSPALDADVFLQEILDKDKTFVLLHRDFCLSAEQEKTFLEWTEKRARGLPVAYIIGKKEFYGLDFFVDQSVLIPKADTEILVSRAVEILSERIGARVRRENSGDFFVSPRSGAQDENRGGCLEVCDMGTGSGCVALSVFRTLADGGRISLQNMPRFTLVDISAAALDVAKKNARALLSDQELKKIRFVQSNLFDRVPRPFDALLSNPPYVPKAEARALLQDGRSEPLLALDGDIDKDGNASGTDDGLAVFRRLVLEAKSNLAAGGDFLCETGECNADAAAAFLRENGFRNVLIDFDLEGQKRLVRAVRRRLRRDNSIRAAKGTSQGLERSAP